jgi:hypothetical protein
MGNPGNSDIPILKGLTQCFKDIPLKFREFIKKKHSVMGKTYFAWLWNMAAPDKTCIRYCVMGRPEWPVQNEKFAGT